MTIDGLKQVVSKGVLCVRCGYELHGLRPWSVCPECGYDIARSTAAWDAKTFQPLDRKLAGRLVLAMRLTLLAFMLGAIVATVPLSSFEIRAHWFFVIFALACISWVIAWYAVWSLPSGLAPGEGDRYDDWLLRFSATCYMISPMIYAGNWYVPETVFRWFVIALQPLLMLATILYWLRLGTLSKRLRIGWLRPICALGAVCAMIVLRQFQPFLTLNMQNSLVRVFLSPTIQFNSLFGLRDVASLLSQFSSEVFCIGMWYAFVIFVHLALLFQTIRSPKALEYDG